MRLPYILFLREAWLGVFTFPWNVILFRESSFPILTKPLYQPRFLNHLVLCELIQFLILLVSWVYTIFSTSQWSIQSKNRIRSQSVNKDIFGDRLAVWKVQSNKRISIHSAHLLCNGGKGLSTCQIFILKYENTYSKLSEYKSKLLLSPSEPAHCGCCVLTSNQSRA